MGEVGGARPHSYHSHSSEPGKQLFTLTVPLFLLSVGSKKKQEKLSILRSHNQGETENAIYEGKFALTKQLYLPNAKFGSDVE